jgi:hypothetical protein
MNYGYLLQKYKHLYIGLESETSIKKLNGELKSADNL